MMTLTDFMGKLIVGTVVELKEVSGSFRITGAESNRFTLEVVDFEPTEAGYGYAAPKSVPLSAIKRIVE